MGDKSKVKTVEQPGNLKVGSLKRDYLQIYHRKNIYMILSVLSASAVWKAGLCADQKLKGHSILVILFVIYIGLYACDAIEAGER